MDTNAIYTEAALEPELEIIDTHHHIWTGPIPGVFCSRKYMVEELRQDFRAGHNIVDSVFVECMVNYRTDGPEHLRSLGETEFINSLEVEKGIMGGIVGFTDLRYGDLAGESLDKHLEIAGSRFKGIRHSVAWDPNPNVYKNHRKSPPHLLVDPTFDKGLQALEDRDLVFESFIYFHQLTDIIEVARKHPDLKIILCHLACPVCHAEYRGHREEVLAEWRKQVAALKDCPNVIMKLGGLGFEPMVPQKMIDGPHTSEAIAEIWKPELMYAIETFGPDRCMVESNFPPDSYLCDYATIWNVFKRATAELSPDERRAIFSETARRVYKL